MILGDDDFYGGFCQKSLMPLSLSPPWICQFDLVFVLLLLCLWVLGICWHSSASGTRFVGFYPGLAGEDESKRV
jgi:hypothetical protein